MTAAGPFDNCRLLILRPLQRAISPIWLSFHGCMLIPASASAASALVSMASVPARLGVGDSVFMTTDLAHAAGDQLGGAAPGALQDARQAIGRDVAAALAERTADFDEGHGGGL